MSPTTSLHTELTWFAFCKSRIASRPPFSLWAAMEWNGLGSAAVTATPTMSNMMPSAINTASTSSVTM